MSLNTVGSKQRWTTPFQAFPFPTLSWWQTERLGPTQELGFYQHLVPHHPQQPFPLIWDQRSPPRSSGCPWTRFPNFPSKTSSTELPQLGFQSHQGVSLWMSSFPGGLEGQCLAHRTGLRAWLTPVPHGLNSNPSLFKERGKRGKKPPIIAHTPLPETKISNNQQHLLRPYIQMGLSSD